MHVFCSIESLPDDSGVLQDVSEFFLQAAYVAG